MFLHSDYVRWLEGAGARVVPVFYTCATEQLDCMFHQLNGIVFPGGADILFDSNGHPTQYYNACKFFLDASVAVKARGATSIFSSLNIGCSKGKLLSCLGYSLLSPSLCLSDENTYHSITLFPLISLPPPSFHADSWIRHLSWLSTHSRLGVGMHVHIVASGRRKHFAPHTCAPTRLG